MIPCIHGSDADKVGTPLTKKYVDVVVQLLIHGGVQ
jgi:hypothetical protein